MYRAVIIDDNANNQQHYKKFLEDNFEMTFVFNLNSVDIYSIQ